MIDQARQAAYELLAAVRTDDAYANIAWPAILARHDLSGRDAAFATDLAYGTLRWQGFYDAVASECSTRPWSEVDDALADVIRLGIHQLLSMRVPDHAAVDSSCELARSLGYDDRGRIGFVNGVLRSVSKRTEQEWQAVVEESRSGDVALAASTSHPQWIVSAMREALTVHHGTPLSDEQVREALVADNVPSRPAIAVRSGAVTDEPGVSPGRWLPSAGIIDSGMPGHISAVREGRAIVQDEGSQLVVQALLAVPVAPPESAWLDMCAGPGGKAALLADAAKKERVSFLAVELHEHRAELVQQLIGAESNAEIVAADATTRPWGSRFFDRILVDAPCTGLGALRRRPEARWRRRASDVAELTSLQRRLLDVGLSSLRSGGVLAYVTCSPHVAETIDVVEEVLLHRDDVEILDAREYLPHVPDLGPGPHAQLWPHLHGTDGMHLALLRRR
ncbi:MAG: rRNA cytosine-C5-methyltransferase [Actinomycetota bacterium]|nr:rRNA cytosine-C5-methyltransferase [Actinomycetota bacterium]